MVAVSTPRGYLWAGLHLANREQNSDRPRAGQTKHLRIFHLPDLVCLFIDGKCTPVVGEYKTDQRDSHTTISGYIFKHIALCTDRDKITSLSYLQVFSRLTLHKRYIFKHTDITKGT